MNPEKHAFRSVKKDGSTSILHFEEEGELPKRKSKTPTSTVADALVSQFFFDYLKGFHIPTYFLEPISDYDYKVKSSTEIPFEIECVNSATEDLAKTFDLDEGAELSTPIMNLYFTDKNYKSVFINESYLTAFGFIEPEEMKILMKQAGKVNAVLKSFFSRRNMFLKDVKLRFVRTTSSAIALGSEFTAKTLQFEDKDTKKARFKIDGENNSLALYERVLGF